MNLLLLYLEFCKVGAFAVGGGLATLPFLFQMADRYTWLDRETVGNFLALAQSSPGAIGVNLAAQTGFHAAGIAGALLAALGLVSPAIVVIALLARMLRAFKENRSVTAVFSGLRPAAAGLLAAAGLGAWKLSLYNAGAPVWYALLRWRECALFALLFLLIWRFKGHPLIYISLGAIAGIVLGL
jgi:chromate transporter